MEGQEFGLAPVGDLLESECRRANCSADRCAASQAYGLDIDSHDLFFGSLVVNGVDVVPFVDAELNRQFPGRELQKAQTPEGLRDGWVAVQAAWETTVANTPPELVDAHVEDEWSLAQTLRHLVLATDAWLRGGIMGMEQPFHEIGLIFTGAAEMGFDMSIFRADAPAFEDILAARAERQQMVSRPRRRGNSVHSLIVDANPFDRRAGSGDGPEERARKCCLPGW